MSDLCLTPCRSRRHHIRQLSPMKSLNLKLPNGWMRRETGTRLNTDNSIRTITFLWRDHEWVKYPAVRDVVRFQRFLINGTSLAWLSLPIKYLGVCQLFSQVTELLRNSPDFS